jgi:hypothetical protein
MKLQRTSNRLLGNLAKVDKALDSNLESFVSKHYILFHWPAMKLKTYHPMRPLGLKLAGLHIIEQA